MGIRAVCPWSPLDPGWGFMGWHHLWAPLLLPPAFGAVTPELWIIFLTRRPSGRLVGAWMPQWGWSGGLASASTGEP